MRRAPIVAVLGPADADAATLACAEELGAGLAAAGATVLTGGLGGVMEAASRGARSRLGATIGILPGDDPDAANGWVELVIPSGLGELRNGLLVSASVLCVAVGGGTGTLSEIALALHAGRPVLGLGTWPIDGVEQLQSAALAVERARALLPQLHA